MRARRTPTGPDLTDEPRREHARCKNLRSYFAFFTERFVFFIDRFVTRVAACDDVDPDLPVAAFGVTFLSAISISPPPLSTCQ